MQSAAISVVIALVLAAHAIGRVRRVISNPKNWPTIIAIMTFGPTILVIGALLVIVEAMARS